jgi:TPR repeat protein
VTDYSVLSCFGYGTERNLFAAIYSAEKGKVGSGKSFEDQLQFIRTTRTSKQKKRTAPRMAEGTQFEFGIGGERNYRKAFERYKNAAEHGLPSAMVCLGVMYKVGQGCDSNLGECVKWLQRAAVWVIDTEFA